jgi:hypothetical protein
MWLFFRSFLAVWTSLLIVLLGVLYHGDNRAAGISRHHHDRLSASLDGDYWNTELHLSAQRISFRISNYRTKGFGPYTCYFKKWIGFISHQCNHSHRIWVFNFSGSSLLDEFAVVSAVNIMVVWVLSGAILPIVFSFLKSPSKKQLKHLESKRMTGLMDYCNRVVFGRRRVIYFVTALVVLATGFGITRIKSVGFIVDDIPKKDKIYTDLKFFEQHFKGIMPFEIWIDSKKKGGFRSLKNMRKVDELQHMLSGYTAFSRPFSAPGNA